MYFLYSEIILGIKIRGKKYIVLLRPVFMGYYLGGFLYVLILAISYTLLHKILLYFMYSVFSDTCHVIFYYPTF